MLASQSSLWKLLAEQRDREISVHLRLRHTDERRRMVFVLLEAKPSKSQIPTGYTFSILEWLASSTLDVRKHFSGFRYL